MDMEMALQRLPDRLVGLLMIGLLSIMFAAIAAAAITSVVRPRTAAYVNEQSADQLEHAPRVDRRVGRLRSLPPG